MPALLDPQARENQPTLLPLSTPQGHPDPTRTFDYTQKYKADAKGQELEHDSRTWKVYMDEHESYDYGMVKGFRENIDALLVFAALFSSVVTGFLVPAAERLEPDNGQISTSILFEATLLLRANGNATLIEATPRSELRPDSVTHTLADVCVAWLFFASLALSLATALISILAKQWLQAFTALVPGDAKQRSLTRQFRFTGMENWKFAEIVGFLPLLLHLSLFLFLVGLCVYVERFHWSFLTMVGFVSLCVAVFYVVTAALPVVYLDCPYRIPILFIPASLCIYAGKQLRYYVLHLWSRGPSRPPPEASSLSTQEHQHVENNKDSLELSSLGWLFSQTTNASVQKIVIYALSRALELYVCRPDGAERTAPPPSFPLEQIHTFALSIIDGVSGIEYIADDIPYFLDFYIHSCKAKGLPELPEFPASRWTKLITSPHLLSFTERGLLPLNGMIEVEDRKEYPLHLACRSERWDLVEKYFDEFDRSHWRMPDSEGWLSLGRAARSDEISMELWEKMIETTEDLMLSLNRDGDRATHLICYYGGDLAKLTSIEDPDWLNFQRPDGQTPLHRLCCNTDNPSQRLEIAKYLCSKGADLGIVDSQQHTPLHFAIQESHSADFIETLCSHALERETEFPASQWTCLMKTPHLLTFTERGLLPLNGMIDVGDGKEYPSHLACRSERWDLVEKYFDEFDRSQWRMSDFEGWLSLGRAARSDEISMELWEKMIETTEDLMLSLNRDGDRATHLICYYGGDLAKLTSIEDPDWLNIQRPDGQTPLHRLCCNTDNPSQRLEIAKYLCSKGANLGIVDGVQWTPLHHACWEFHSADFIETLLSHLQTVENGGDILNKRDKNEWTALDLAVCFGRLDSQSIQALILAGADPNIADDYGSLPLHLACCPFRSSPRRDYIAILLDHTNDINKRDGDGRTPLDRLMDCKGQNGWQDIYNLMREKGAKHASEL